jgi:hypothetical protein
LRDIQWLDYWRPSGFDRLVKAIEAATGHPSPSRCESPYQPSYMASPTESSWNIEAKSWQIHDHPTLGYSIMLDVNRLTVFDPPRNQIYFTVSALPNRKWVVLRDGRKQKFPIKVYRDGYVANGLSHKGRLLIEWLP